MVNPSQVISAVAKPLAGTAPSKGGTGTVERRVDSSTYVINLGRENMTVKVTEGALSIGQQVTVAAQNGKLIIKSAPTPQDEETARSGKQPDSFTEGKKAPQRQAAPAVRTAVDNVIQTLSRGTVRPEDAKQAHAQFKTIEQKLSSFDEPLTKAASKALSSIAETPETDSVPPDAVATAVKTMEQLRDKIPAFGFNGQSGRSVAIQSSSKAGEGIFTFKSVSDAVEFLKPALESREAFAREIDAQLQKDGSVTVRTETYGKQGLQIATVLTKEELSREVESLPGRFSSRAFQSIPPAVFKELLESRGSIDLEKLKSLDDYAAELNLPAASTRAGSRSAQDAALLQWLSSACDARTPSPALSSMLPVFSASSIVDGLEEIAQSVSQLSGNVPDIPAAEDFSITQESVAKNQDRSRLLETIVTRLGFTLENSLGTNGQLPASSSLKEQLLQTFRALETAAPPSAAAVRASATLTKIAEDFIASVRSQLAPLLDSAGNGTDKALGREIEAVLQKAAENFAKTISRSTAEAEATAQTLPQKLTVESRGTINECTGNAVRGIEEQASELSDELETLLQKAAAKASTDNRGSAPVLAEQPAETVPGKPPASALLQSAAKLEKLALEAASQKQAALSPESETTIKSAEAGKPAIATGRPSVTEQSDSGKSVERSRESFSRDAQAVLRKNAEQVLRLLDQLKTEATDLARSIPEKLSVAAPRPSTEKQMTQAQIAALSKSDEAAVQKIAVPLVKVLDQLSARARELAGFAGTADGSKTTNMPEKNAVGVRAAVAAFAEDASKQIEALRKNMTATSGISTKSAFDNSAVAIQKLLEQTREIPAKALADGASKLSAAAREAVVAFAGDSQKRLETLLKQMALETETAIQKTAVKPEARLAADAIEAIKTFAKDTGKQITVVIQDMQIGNEAAIRKTAAENVPADLAGTTPRNTDPAALAEKLIAASRKAIETFGSEATERIEALVRDLASAVKTASTKEPAEAVKLLKELADISKELQRTTRTLPAKITATTLAAIDQAVGNGAKQIGTLEKELSQASQTVLQKSASQFSSLVEQLTGELSVVASRTNTVSSLPLKVSAMMQSVMDTFAGDRGKQVENLLEELSQSTNASVQKNAIELTKLINQVATKASDLVQSQTLSTPSEPTAPELSQKTASLVQSTIETFTGDTGKRIENLLNEISRSNQAPVQKSAAELSKHLNQVSAKAIDLVPSRPQTQPNTGDSKSTVPALPQKAAAVVQSAIETLTGDTGKRIENLLKEISRSNQVIVQKNAAELTKILTQVTTKVADLKQPPQQTLPGSADSESTAPALPQKAASMVQSAIETFSGETGKRIENLLKEISRSNQVPIQKHVAELTKLLGRVSAKAAELARSPLQQRPPGDAPEETVTGLPQKAASLVQSAIEAFTGETGKRIENLLSALSHSNQAPVQKSAVALMKLLNQVSAKGAELAQSAQQQRSAAGVPESATSALPARVSSMMQSTIDTFTGDSGKRIENRLNEISRNSQAPNQKDTAEALKLLRQVVAKATDLVQPLSQQQRQQTIDSALEPITPSLPEKVSSTIQVTVETFTGDTGKRIEALLNEISRSSEAPVQKNAIELSKLLEQVSAKVTDLVQSPPHAQQQSGIDLPASTGSAPPAKIVSLMQSTVETFTGDMGKRIEALLNEISLSSSAESTRKNAADLTALINQVVEKVNDLAEESRPGFSNASAPALRERVRAMVQSAIDALSTLAEKNLETQNAKDLRENEIVLRKNIADFQLVLKKLSDHLSDSGTEKSVALRLALQDFLSRSPKSMESLLKQSVGENETLLRKNLADLSKLFDEFSAESETEPTSKIGAQKLLQGPGQFTSLLATDAVEEEALKPAQDFLRDAAASLKKGFDLSAIRPMDTRGAETPAEKLTAALENAVNTFADGAEKQIGTLQRELSEKSGTVMEKGTELLRQLIREAENLAGEPRAARQGDPAAAAQKTGPSDNSRPLEEEIARLARAARELPENIAGSLRSALSSFSDEAGRLIESRARELSDSLLRQAEVSVERQTAEGTAGKSAAAAVQTALERDLPALHQKIDDLKPLVNRATETLFRELLHGQNRDPSAPAPGAPERVLDDQSLVRQSVQQNIDTLLNRFESLQILARQVQNPAGEQQQILAVPIKVGSEWTEMHVRFVNKKRKNAAGGSDGHYLVHLNVAPSLLGAIGATMDYTQKKTLNISMQFEHQATRQWFAANKEALAETLQALGLPSPRIALSIERKPAFPALSPAAAPAGGMGSPAAGGSGSLNSRLDVKA